jgi:hypothetical protein
MGMCVPSSCMANDIQIVYQNCKEKISFLEIMSIKLNDNLRHIFQIQIIVIRFKMISKI